MAKVCPQLLNYYSIFPECYFTWLPDDNSTFRVATLLTHDGVSKRIKQSYDEGMGIAPVMAYNIDLDDFEGSCSGGTYLSPIIHALATASF
ncbi:hypothetical protein HPB49_023458 [Dermacentor silvarum]|uniref:Uncharacterized protein n=1 Tax=Dermacentor silvarum TaxID=543639 RepID=A0ACB8DRY5_DERSI|nr:hypothetical protein HPB49_023458 [Dermacentor silvarum]